MYPSLTMATNPLKFKAELTLFKNKSRSIRLALMKLKTENGIRSFGQLQISLKLDMLLYM